MNTRHSRRISRKAAEQLLDGAAVPDRSHAQASGGSDQLARVLAAAAAPGREHELAGEQMAVAAFDASHLESVASNQRGQMIKSPLAKLLTAKVLAATLTVFAGGGVGGDGVDGVLGGVVGGGPAGQVVGRDGDLRGAAGGVAQVVQGAVPGDGGGPAAEVVVVAGEAGQVAGDLEPGLGRDVLGVLADQGVQVAQQPGLDVAVQDPERLRVTPLGTAHDLALAIHPPHDGASAGAVAD